MPIDAPKHPSTYPIWMRQAIEAALSTPGQAVFAVEFNDDAHERGLRRRFRAYVKALRVHSSPHWGPSWSLLFAAHRFRLERRDTLSSGWLELIAWPIVTDQNERLEACKFMSALVGGQKTLGAGK